MAPNLYGSPTNLARFLSRGRVYDFQIPFITHPESVVGCDGPEFVRVADEAAEKVHRLDQHVAGRWRPHHSRVVAGSEANDDVIAHGALGELCQRSGQDRRPHLTRGGGIN